MEVSEEMNTGNENRSYRERIFSRYQTLTSTGTFALRDYEEWAEKVGKRNFLKFLPKDMNSRILDAGCGTGKFLYFLRKHGYSNAIGVDVGEENIIIASKLGITNAINNDIFDFLKKTPPLCFEMVYCQDVIEHLSKNEIVELLDLIYRVLKPGAMTIFVTANVGGFMGGINAFSDFTHETFFTPGSLKEIFKMCNFRNAKVYPFDYFFSGYLRRKVWFLIKSFVKIFVILQYDYPLKNWKEVIVDCAMFIVARK